MKPFIQALSCFLFLTIQAHAFWIARPIQQRVLDSDCIVLATFEGFETTSKSEGVEDQRGKFRLVRPIKGSIEETFFVLGMKTMACFPLVDFTFMQKKDTFLLFLGSADNTGVRFPVDASIIQITDGKLMWSDPGEKDFQLRTIQHVERSIRSIARNPPSQRAKLRS